jgi:hypothetical protein
MSKHSRREVYQAWQQQVKASPNEVEQSAETQQAEARKRLACERADSIAAGDWPPDSLAERMGFEFARSGGDHGTAVAASKVLGFFGARIYMRGFLSALGPAAYERGER